MAPLVELDWGAYTAAALMALEAALAAWGLTLEVRGFRRPRYDLDKVLAIVRGFRLFVAGTAVAGLGAAWAWHVPWLLALSAGHWRGGAVGDVHRGLRAAARKEGRGRTGGAALLRSSRELGRWNDALRPLDHGPDASPYAPMPGGAYGAANWGAGVILRSVAACHTGVMARRPEMRAGSPERPSG